VEEEPARRRAGVDALVQHHEIDARSRQLCGERGQMPHAAAEPVELGHDHGRDLSPPGVGQEPVEGGPAVFCAGDAGIDAFLSLDPTGRGILAQSMEPDLGVLV